MKTTQKTFTLNLHTTNTDIDLDKVVAFMEKAINDSEYSDDLTCTIDTEVKTLYNFLNDTMAFSFFIRKSKEEFLEDYPYFAEEYDFCLSEFNKNPQEALLEFLENTSTEELTEPYSLLPPDFSSTVGIYINNHFSKEEQIEFLQKVVERGLKVEIY